VKATESATVVTLKQLWNESDIIWQLRTLMLPGGSQSSKMEVVWRGLSDCTIHDFRGSATIAQRAPSAGWIQTGEACWELEEEGCMQTAKHTWNWRKKGECRQGSILGTGGRRVDANREAYLELEEGG
jgi:hypothetical protein